MIDIFVEEIENNELTAFFVQLGCVYNCTYDNLTTLCDNIVSLYIESNKDENENITYQFLPIPIYHRMYKTTSKFLFSKNIKENISYVVKKIC